MRPLLIACCIALSVATAAHAQNASVRANSVRDATVVRSETPAANGVAIDRAVRDGMTNALPPEPGTCRDGFVWRQASASDRICAPPASRERVAAENAQDAANRDPFCAPNPFSPDGCMWFPSLGTCKSGFVPRNALPNDGICVTPAARDEAWHENTLAAGRTHL